MDYFFIGDDELVTAFRLVGIEGAAVRDPAGAETAFRRVTETGPGMLPGAEGCRVLILTDEVAGWLDEIVVAWQFSGQYPLIVEIPSIMGRNPNRKSLVDSIREAIGIHV